MCGSRSIDPGERPGDDMSLRRPTGMSVISLRIGSWFLVLGLTHYFLAPVTSTPTQAQEASPRISIQRGVVKLADSNIEYFSQGHGESIVLLPFGGPAGGKVPPDPPGERALQAIFNPASTDDDILSQMTHMVGEPAQISMAWRAIKPCRAPQVAGMQRTAMQNTPLSEWWAPPGKAKYLIVQGTNDEIAPPENGRLLKKELGDRAALVSLPGEGHLFVVTEPKKAAAVVVSFLRQNRA